MADTVEQVYIWDGNDWTPVVRDETVSKTSELTNDGEDGVNPFITAADIPAVPDKNLPISSEDGTVTLSDSSGRFHVETGGKKQFNVTSSGTIGQGYAGQVNIGVGLYTQYATSSDCNAVEWGVCAFPVFDAQPASNATVFESQPIIKSEVRAVLSHFKATDGRGGNEDINNTQMGFVCESLTRSTTANFGFVSNVNEEPGKSNYQFLCNGDAPSSFRGRVICADGLHTNKITSVADAVGDGTIDLSGQNVNIKSNNKNQIQVNDINCLRTLQVGSASQPALAFSDTTTGFFFAPDDANQYDANGSGIAFTIANANSGVAEREIFRFTRNGQVVGSKDYVVLSPKSFTTKEYVDSRIWTGTQSEYDALGTYDDSVLYCITD